LLYYFILYLILKFINLLILLNINKYIQILLFYILLFDIFKFKYNKYINILIPFNKYLKPLFLIYFLYKFIFKFIKFINFLIVSNIYYIPSSFNLLQK
jgi:hypothetical protein